MKNVVVVGSQWGDEGKGKIVDWLSSEADVVVRFQGGHNAGHTLVIDKKVFKLRLLPSGIVRKGKISILGNGVVIDPWALLSEIEEIKKCFAMYVKFPKKRWKEIERAEKNDAEGTKIFNELKVEYLEKYMPKSDADPHGGIEDFIEADKLNQCMPIPKSNKVKY